MRPSIPQVLRAFYRRILQRLVNVSDLEGMTPVGVIKRCHLPKEVLFSEETSEIHRSVSGELHWKSNDHKHIYVLRRFLSRVASHLSRRRLGLLDSR